MKLKNFLVSLLVVGSSSVLAVDVADIKAEVSYKDQMINQAERFVERTVNLIATPFMSDKDVECLARNIFYEAGSESLEGKVAVAMVTINRAQDSRYPRNVCGVVQQKTLTTSPQKTTTVRTVKEDFLSPPKQVVETQITWVQRVVCQFSWTCTKVSAPKASDPRWIESQEVAQNIARGGYSDLKEKYSDAKHFHAIHVNPGWKLKKITRTGNHIFYE